MSGTRERTLKGHTEHYRQEGLGRFRDGERQGKDRSACQTDGTLNRNRDKDKSDVGLGRRSLILGARRRHKTFDGELDNGEASLLMYKGAASTLAGPSSKIAT